MMGKAHSGQVELQILQCSALAMATAPSMNISAHSFIAPLGTGSLHHCVARQPKQHLHQKMNKPIRLVRGGAYLVALQDRKRTLWVDSGLWLLESASELEGTRAI